MLALRVLDPGQSAGRGADTTGELDRRHRQVFSILALGFKSLCRYQFDHLLLSVSSIDTLPETALRVWRTACNGIRRGVVCGA